MYVSCPALILCSIKYRMSLFVWFESVFYENKTNSVNKAIRDDRITWKLEIERVKFHPIRESSMRKSQDTFVLVLLKRHES